MDIELLSDLYKKTLIIRRFEEESARLYTQRKIAGFLHLYIGQEALAVGADSVIQDNDYVITSYRCHGHYLARGGDIGAGFAELMGKETGCAKGRGGSMHFYDLKNNFWGGWGIVGAQIPVATGMAFSSKYKNEKRVALCYLGDGSINIGPFHEGLSLAALWELPVVFIIENNQFAMGTPIDKTSPVEDLSIRALGYPMARASVDGHNTFEIREVVHSAVERAREKNLPTLIEAKTYRYRGHSMSDPAKYRTKEELQEWKERDPVITLGEKVRELGSEELRKKIEDQVEEDINKGMKFAEESNEPDPKTAFDFIMA